VFVNQRHKVLFFHNPKTAGRSLFQTFGFSEGENIRLSHFYPEEAKTTIFQETWGDYWKFAFVRNPWDRYVSLYEFHKQSPYIAKYNWKSQQIARAYSFREWMFYNRNRFIFATWWGDPQSLWWKGMDCVFKFEELDTAVEEISKHLPPIQPLMHDNATVRKPYQDYYNKDLVGIVAEIDRETIKQFGYKFG
jgi:hypothetical protein